MSYREGWILVNDVPTHVLTWGGWIEETIPKTNSVIICISGNPGITHFYNRFLSSLHKEIGVPVWILSHAGHELPPDPNMVMPMNRDLYNLAGQVAHKAAFIEKYVPHDCKIYFIGHSVGAKIVTELLKDKELYARTVKGYLMFPTLERIADTPNGKFLVPVVHYGLSVILFFAWVYSLFPNVLRTGAIRIYFALAHHILADNDSIKAGLHLTLPNVLRSVFFLAMDEMKEIKELDVKSLNEFREKLKVYFGVSDGWAPLAYYESLKAAVPDIDASVVDQKYKHAFVLFTPEEMATFLADEIKREFPTDVRT